MSIVLGDVACGSLIDSCLIVFIYFVLLVLHMLHSRFRAKIKIRCMSFLHSIDRYTELQLSCRYFVAMQWHPIGALMYHCWSY